MYNFGGKKLHWSIVELLGTPSRWVYEVDVSHNILQMHLEVLIRLLKYLEEKKHRDLLIYIHHKTLWKFLTGEWTPRKPEIVEPFRELILICHRNGYQIELNPQQTKTMEQRAANWIKQ